MYSVENPRYTKSELKALAASPMLTEYLLLCKGVLTADVDNTDFRVVNVC